MDRRPMRRRGTDPPRAGLVPLDPSCWLPPLDVLPSSVRSGPDPRLLSHHVHFLAEGWDLTPWCASWAYALPSRLERSVHRDDAEILREFLREFWWRAKQDLPPAKGKGGHAGGTAGGTEGMEDEALASLNVLVAVVGVFSSQGGGMSELFPSAPAAAEDERLTAYNQV